MNLPAHANVVIIGGGIIGCSIAYHLTKIGITDVLLLERKQLCCGTTWHSVGSVAELRGNRRMTELASYTAGLYQRLEQETGQATGYKKSGSIMLALNKERLMEMERSAALGRAFGHEAEIISVADVNNWCPQVVTDDALAGLYIPSDGRTNPIDTTQALAKGARMGGARIVENVRVNKLDVRAGAVRGVETDLGPVSADAVVLATGMWAREFAAAHGVSLPLQAAEHFYAVTENIDGLQPSMPFIRVPDESTYYKEDAGKLLFGCLEKMAKPWAMDGIPAGFCFDSLPEDLDHFEPILYSAMKRFPLLENAGIQLFFNGPESFTPDGNALVGETPELTNLFVACGLNTVGVMAGGGIGMMLAQWIHDRRRPEGFAEFDVARMSSFQSGRNYLHDRTVEAVGVLYGIGWPNKEYASGRGGRRIPLHEMHETNHAIFGNRAGWEVPLVYADSEETAELQPSFDKQHWLDWTIGEVKAAEQEAGLFDLSAAAKLRIRGADAIKALSRMSGDMTKPGLQTAIWQNKSGRIHACVSVLVISGEEVFVLSAPGTERLHSKWITDNGVPREAVEVVTSSFAQFMMLGTLAGSVLETAGCSPSSDQLQSGVIGYAPVTLAATSVGHAEGWLLLVQTEFAAHAFETLQAAGKFRLCGSYALEFLRIAAGEPAWPGELNDMVGLQEAGLAEPSSGARNTALVRISLTEDRGILYGQESILNHSVPVGLTTSGAWCHRSGVSVALGYVSDNKPIDQNWIVNGDFAVDMPGGPVGATLELANLEKR